MSCFPLWRIAHCEYLYLGSTKESRWIRLNWLNVLTQFVYFKILNPFRPDFSGGGGAAFYALNPQQIKRGCYLPAIFEHLSIRMHSGIVSKSLRPQYINYYSKLLLCLFRWTHFPRVKAFYGWLRSIDLSVSLLEAVIFVIL